jgi:hypothetical protein
MLLHWGPGFGKDKVVPGPEFFQPGLNNRDNHLLPLLLGSQEQMIRIVQLDCIERQV